MRESGRDVLSRLIGLASSKEKAKGRQRGSERGGEGGGGGEVSGCVSVDSYTAAKKTLRLIDRCVCSGGKLVVLG